MKIERIDQTKPLHMRSVTGSRCEEKIRVSGTATFPSFIIDGEKLCKQHAGDKTLKYLLNNQKDLVK